MKFWEAVRAIEEGKKVRVIEWAPGVWINRNGFDDHTSINSLDLRECLHLNYEWELYEETEKQLTFTEVVKGLKEGKRFRRKKWPNEKPYIKIEDSGIKSIEALIYSPWYSDPEDLEATDWVEVP